MMNEYTIEIYEVNPVTGAFTRIDELSTFYNLSFSERLNAVGMASFSLNAYDEKATTRNLKRFKNQILIKRNSTPVWVGTIANVNTGSITRIVSSIPGIWKSGDSRRYRKISVVTSICLTSMTTG